jgi:hypothetical protein
MAREAEQHRQCDPFQRLFHALSTYRRREIHLAETLNKAAYSDARSRCKQSSGCADRQKRACKRRANCLNPKRKLKTARVAAIVTLTYRAGEPLLKADVAKQENLRGARLARVKLIAS